MSYLDRLSREIRRTDTAAFYIVDGDAADQQLDAEKFAERRYARDAGYDGLTHTVCDTQEDDWRVIVMEEAEAGQ